MSEARFIVQRPESPEWFAGWDHGLALWVCDAGDAMFVRPDELVETMARLAKERPIASLYLPTLSKPDSPADEDWEWRLVRELIRIESEADKLLDSLLYLDLPEYSDGGTIGAAYYQDSCSALNRVSQCLGSLRAQLEYHFPNSDSIKEKT
jgi:hypothetical protein